MFSSKVQPVKNRLSTSLNVTLAGEDVIIEQDDLSDGLNSDHAINLIPSSRELIVPQLVSVFSVLSVSSILSAFSLIILPVSSASSKPPIKSS